ncbi:hypothetical protein CQ010_03795 [Arthrobacter sp. MYb211]|uniref:hypothetical protein n=1 Tax=Micrococcaceae TaxID=1268 RepID=UPI000CFDC023|nr:MULTISPECIES: hypothetical protein [unclassified Arthrobacter]PRA01303.1 hypothetical protein CQ017_02055 [Arthrobacter sp. MYb224]PRA06504.1 hypothetical protein CQ019_03725 [Arthrobacter sp. MYb229]PRA12564.1 hypothetical protein CQ015_04735 [Arthrobacter sp. MYb221]PRB53406.1 hypothetical protein CQ013_03725 [Arthrobacter sp. MYb216]PRC09917.1 hypothetical protein CQ010_03795 [Arthrobacter sp. MYb211]
MVSDALVFEDSNSVSDLANLLSRAKAIEDDGALLTARGTALAVYVPVLVPAELGQGDYTILGMRVHRLAVEGAVNACYSFSAIQDRLARMGEASTEFVLPPVEENPRWAAITVPMAGWEDAGSVPDDVLSAATQTGIDAVAQALPANPGKPVVAQIRQRIWSSELENTEPRLPLGAAFAMHALGFLTPGGESRVLRQGNWIRVSNGLGHVLLRRSALLA